MPELKINFLPDCFGDSNHKRLKTQDQSQEYLIMEFNPLGESKKQRPIFSHIPSVGQNDS